MTALAAWCALLAAAVVIWPSTRRALPPGPPPHPAPDRAPTARHPAPERTASARRGGRDTRARDESLAELLALLVGPLRSGAPPAVALEAARVAQGPGPFTGVVDDLVTAGHRAEPLAPVWQGWAERLDSDDLRFVGRAWELTEQNGSPLVEALTASLEVVRARRRSADRVASAAAGPRASMLVLLLLPLSGPVVGLACGIDPRTLYLSSPAATGSLAAGIALALLARWWSGRILAGAA